MALRSRSSRRSAIRRRKPAITPVYIESLETRQLLTEFPHHRPTAVKLVALRT